MLGALQDHTTHTLAACLAPLQDHTTHTLAACLAPLPSSAIQHNSYTTISACTGGGGWAGPLAVPGAYRGHAHRAAVRGGGLCQAPVRGVHHPQRGEHGERPARLLPGHQRSARSWCTGEAARLVMLTLLQANQCCRSVGAWPASLECLWVLHGYSATAACLPGAPSGSGFMGALLQDGQCPPWWAASDEGR